MDHRAAKVDDERARLEDADARQIDPHGIGPARRADRDEPLAWPSSDRQELETTVNRVEQGSAADVTPPHEAGRDIEPQLGMARVVLSQNQVSKKEISVMDSKETRENKLEKPHAHFGRPREVVADPALSKEEKAEALETLEQDARLLTTATQEAMTGGLESKLPEVLDAKKALEESTGTTNPASAGNPSAGSDAEVAKEVEIEKLDP